jgi:hypothetical protein
VPAVPAGNEVVVIVKVEEAGLMEIERLLDADCAGEPESVTRTVKLYWPAAVGVPLMLPLEARVKPEGRLPELTAQL